MNLPRADQPQWAPWLNPVRFAGLICLLILAAYWKVLLGGESFYFRDYGVLGYPCMYYNHAAFWRGEIPLWNPLSNCGAPFLAQWGTMTLYPLSLFYLILPLPWSLTCFCFGHLLLGAMGIYFLAWRWSSSRFGAALAATAYIFNGVTFSCLGWPNYLVALAWMPWVVLTTERAWSLGGRSIIIAAMLAGLQLLSGVPEIALLTWILTGTLWLRALLIQREGRIVTARRFLFVILLAAGLVAAQLLPFFDLLLHSQRDRTFSVSRWAMPSWGWGNFLVPLFHCFRTPQGPFFQHTQEFFGSYYLGVGLLTLAGWAIWKARDARVLILAGLSIAAVLLALGENGFLFPIIKRIFPIAGIARYPVKFLILPAFALPMIAAFAIARLESREQTGIRDQRSLMLTAMVTLALIALVLLLAKLHPLPYDQWLVTFANGMFRALFLGLFTACLVLLCRDLPQQFRTGLVLALLVIIFADARTHTPEQNPSVTAEALAPGLWQARGNAPGPQRGESRVFITPSAEQHLLANSVARPIDQLLGQRLALWSNLHLLDGVAKVNGSSTLQIREQKQLEQRLYEVTNSLPAGLLDFLAVSHISSAENLVDWVARSNYCALVTAGQRPEFADEQAILRSVTQPDFNPRTTVFLPLETKASIPIGSCRPVQINELQFSSQRVGFNATAAEPAVCVIAQSFYHCWKASIDGQPVRLLRANGAFQAVIVPAGSHQVVLRYQDGMFWTGVAISLASLAICGILWRCTRPKLYSEDFVVSGLSSAPME